MNCMTSVLSWPHCVFVFDGLYLYLIRFLLSYLLKHRKKKVFVFDKTYLTSALTATMSGPGPFKGHVSSFHTFTSQYMGQVMEV